MCYSRNTGCFESVEKREPDVAWGEVFSATVNWSSL